MKKVMIYICVSFIWTYSYSQEKHSSFFGYNIPYDTPEIFAEGVVSYPFMNHSSVTISKNMDAMYWSKWYNNETRQEIVYSELKDNRWSEPEVVSFSGQYSDDVPFLSPDNKRLYFISRRPISEKDNSNIERIWYSIKENNKWSEPIMVSTIVNCENIHWQFSVAEDYSIYYNGSDGIKFSKYFNGEYKEPKPITQEFNVNYIGGNPFISPKEDYIIFSSRHLSDTKGKNDLYIGYKTESGLWSDPINLGDNINGLNNELCPNISPDGNILFFIKQVDTYDIYWVSAECINKLKENIDKR